MELPGAAGTTPVTMRGDVDFTGRRSHLTIDLAALSAAAADLPPEGSRGLTGIEVISDGLVSCVKLPGLDGLTGGRGMWIKTDTARMPADSGIDTGGLSAPTGTDPVADARPAPRPGRRAHHGRDRGRGGRVDHALARHGRPEGPLRTGRGRCRQSAELEAALAAFTGPVVLDVWVDAAGLVRRQTLTVLDHRRGPAPSATSSPPSAPPWRSRCPPPRRRWTSVSSSATGGEASPSPPRGGRASSS